LLNANLTVDLLLQRSADKLLEVFVIHVAAEGLLILIHVANELVFERAVSKTYAVQSFHAALSLWLP